MKGLYLDAGQERSYVRDRNVFGENITIEDTMSVTARYRNGVVLTYSLVAYSPWEGYRCTITGTKGCIEVQMIEKDDFLLLPNTESKPQPENSVPGMK